MGPQEKIFKREYAFELIKIAKGDLESASELSQAKSGRKENVVYLAQQSVEKAIKSVICFLQKPIPFSHDVLVLLTKLDESQYPPGGITLADLTPYATIRRYEEGVFELSKQDLDAVLQLAGNVVGWAEKKLGQ